jgi:elongation factor G
MFWNPFQIEANINRPQAFYRETIRKAVTQEGKYIRQSGGDSYGVVVIKVELGELGIGLKFSSQLVGDTELQHYVGAVEAGIQETCALGILAGYPVTRR